MIAGFINDINILSPSCRMSSSEALHNSDFFFSPVVSSPIILQNKNVKSNLTLTAYSLDPTALPEWLQYHKEEVLGESRKNVIIFSDASARHLLSMEVTNIYDTYISFNSPLHL